jgi:ABC-type multidrug transport system ATPase subunit
MYVDGKPIDESFNRRIGYCQQMDIHDESSTVREAFEFSALLRQAPDVPDEEKLAYARTVLMTLDLVDLQDAVIGSLDIEKKKRVTIGVELCARPEMLLFLDEPTSGLDSQAASNTCALLRRLADQGLAILCTIHQANQEQFEQFDRVLALSPGGKTYYFGEVGESGSAIFEYFTKHDEKPENVTNAADFLIEVVVGGMKSSTTCRDWASIWTHSNEARKVQEEIANIRCKRENATESGATRQSMPPLSRQIFLLTQRTLRQFWRSPEYPYSRIYASFFHALINGLTYLQIGNSTTDLQSKAFSCFLVLMLVPEFINAISMRFIMNRDLWKAREGPSGIYGWIAFCTAQIVSEIPYAIVSAVIFFVLYYFTVGLPLGFAAGYSFLMFFLFFLFATSWGQWIAALRYFISHLSSVFQGTNSDPLQCRLPGRCDPHAVLRHHVRALQRSPSTSRQHASILGLHHVLRHPIHILDRWSPDLCPSRNARRLCRERINPLPKPAQHDLWPIRGALAIGEGRRIPLQP